MNREQALLLLQALRRGDKKALAEMFARLAREHRIVCRHCGEKVAPLIRRYDFEEMQVRAECSSCGKPNLLPMKSFAGLDPSQSQSGS